MKKYITAAVMVASFALAVNSFMPIKVSATQAITESNICKGAIGQDHPKIAEFILFIEENASDEEILEKLTELFRANYNHSCTEEEVDILLEKAKYLVEHIKKSREDKKAEEDKAIEDMKKDLEEEQKKIEEEEKAREKALEEQANQNSKDENKSEDKPEEKPEETQPAPQSDEPKQESPAPIPQEDTVDRLVISAPQTAITAPNTGFEVKNPIFEIISASTVLSLATFFLIKRK